MTILLLDDEAMVRGVMRTVLSNAGYKLLEAQNANEALTTGVDYPGEIGLFIADHTLMDEYTGHDVAQWILQFRPSVRVLHISGYPQGQLKCKGTSPAGWNYLAKPFSPKQLLAKVQELVGRAD